VGFNIGSLGRAVSVAALVLSAGTAQAQFDPFGLFKPQQAPQPAPQSAPPPQRAQPAAPTTQQPSQKAQQPAAPKTSQKAPPAAPATASAPYGEVRTACQSEIKGTCAGVVPGSTDSVQCLKRNFAVHSPACQAALSRAGSTAPQPAAAPAQPAGPAGTAEAPRRISTDRVAAPTPPAESLKPLATPTMRPTQEARFVSRHCREDHSLLCQGVTFGQGRVLKCLVAQQASLTNDCKKAMAALR